MDNSILVMPLTMKSLLRTLPPTSKGAVDPVSSLDRVYPALPAVRADAALPWRGVRLLMISSNVVNSIRIILIFCGSASTAHLAFSALTAERQRLPAGASAPRALVRCNPTDPVDTGRQVNQIAKRHCVIVRGPSGGSGGENWAISLNAFVGRPGIARRLGIVCYNITSPAISAQGEATCR